VALAAAGTPAGGKIKIFVASPDELKSQVVIIGAVGDHGTAISQETGSPTSTARLRSSRSPRARLWDAHELRLKSRPIS
jgi:hypothetical protein